MHGFDGKGVELADRILQLISSIQKLDHTLELKQVNEISESFITTQDLDTFYAQIFPIVFSLIAEDSKISYAHKSYIYAARSLLFELKNFLATEAHRENEIILLLAKSGEIE